jgi:23S rRNA (guanosine2251-2'-O)-methyltransferase
MQKISLILHNIRSTYNVGAITRTAECLGIEKIHATGYTPFTVTKNSVLPHILKNMKNSIHKTALGAEDKLPVVYEPDVLELISFYKNKDYEIIALEQNKKSKNIVNFKAQRPIAIILGEEVNGVSDELLNLVDQIIELPMLGMKESFNVSVATGIMLFELRRDYFIVQ